MSSDDIQVQQRWRVTCEKCPDMDILCDTAGEAEDSARAHLDWYTEEEGCVNYGHTVIIAQITKVGRYVS